MKWELRLFVADLDQSATRVHLASGREAWLATREGGRLHTRGTRTWRGKKSSKHIVIPPSDSILRSRRSPALRQLQIFLGDRRRRKPLEGNLVPLNRSSMRTRGDLEPRLVLVAVKGRATQPGAEPGRRPFAATRLSWAIRRGRAVARPAPDRPRERQGQSLPAL